MFEAGRLRTEVAFFVQLSFLSFLTSFWDDPFHMERCREENLDLRTSRGEVKTLASRRLWRVSCVLCAICGGVCRHAGVSASFGYVDRRVLEPLSNVTM